MPTPIVIAEERVGPVVLVHGGAGGRAEEADDLAAGCALAAARGAAALRAGAGALEAAIVAVEVLEDDPRYNAGTGAALTEAGGIELDASVMEGTTLRAGGVAALGPFRHPVRAALAVLDDDRHVLMTGAGGEELALAAGLQRSSLADMRTARAIQRLESVTTGRSPRRIEDGLDTVGAVAVDPDGRVAAATSTGGIVGQRPGRVGDTPVVGAGTYADDRGAACSATGTGEAFLRAGTARAVVDACRQGRPVAEAARASLTEVVERFGGTGGLIVVDPTGRLAAVRSTPAMAWAWDDGVDRRAHGW
ncbi:MAG: isoaspartyl peptidase/L-asparaginase [Actinomycetota bacterium]